MPASVDLQYSNIESHNHSNFDGKFNPTIIAYGVFGSLREAYDSKNFCYWVRLLLKVELVVPWVQVL